MRDGAAVRDRVGAGGGEDDAVGLALVVGACGQLRPFGRHPRVRAVAQHGILPDGGAGAVGEAEAFVVVVDVRVVGGACGIGRAG